MCILGSLVRLLYGYLYTPWTQAPDQLAWELLIDQPGFRYDHLIHYPHEGGSILIAVWSKFLKFFTDFNSLTILAFLLDFLVRYTQISIVQQIFSWKITLLFGVWTIFAAPYMIPWGTVNFGLHAISSIFPFLMLFLFSKPASYAPFYGFFTGLACWFSYSNIVLIPALFLFHGYNRHDLRKWLYSILGLSTILTIHLVTRYFADPGFHLRAFNAFSIRGEILSISNIPFKHRLTQLPETLSNAALALSVQDKFLPILRPVYLLLTVLALIGWWIQWIQWRRRAWNKQIMPAFSILFFFLISYLLSPFFYSESDGNYISFRHLMYILPLLSLFLILGLSAFRTSIPVFLFLALGIFQSVRLFTLPKNQEHDQIIKAIGWILGTKSGHDPQTLIAVIRQNPDEKELLIQGIGWGVTASLFSDLGTTDTHTIEVNTNRLIQLSDALPGSFQKDLLTGVEYAFSTEVSPHLDPEIHIFIQKKIEAHFREHRKT